MYQVKVNRGIRGWDDVETFSSQEEAVKFAQEYARKIIKIEVLKTEIGNCYQCGKELPIREYSIRKNYQNCKIKCCSDKCADEAQMSAED